MSAMGMKLGVFTMVGLTLLQTLPNREATISEQRAIELAAVTFREDTHAGFALDPRTYNLPWAYSGPAARWAPPIKGPRVYLPASHDSTHLAAIAARLAITTIIDDAKSCPVNGPALCRMEGSRGIVAFSPAVINGASAQIIIFRFERRETSPGDRLPGGMSAIVSTSGYYTLKLSKDGWQVVGWIAKIG
jgi:hypothetical protein